MIQSERESSSNAIQGIIIINQTHSCEGDVFEIGFLSSIKGLRKLEMNFEYSFGYCLKCATWPESPKLLLSTTPHRFLWTKNENNDRIE
jgi:hypothetical protein